MGDGKFIVKAGYVPPAEGFHTARYDGQEDVDLAGYGERWRWKFTIQAGAGQGKQISALTSRDITSGTNAGKVVAGLVGGVLQPGDDVGEKLQAAVGKVYLVDFRTTPKSKQPSVVSVGQVPEM